MKRVLVTGATGFCGSHVIERLMRQDAIEPVAACRDPSRLPAGFAGEVREGDLTDDDYLATLCGDIDVICHCAAWSSLFRHKKRSGELFLDPSLRLIEAAHRQGVTRFINISTTSAAAPDASADAMSRGIPRAWWPHLCNVIAIEERLRELAGERFTVINLRLGLFAGNRYALGLLPILLPRLKTHLVPWVAGGRTGLPLIDGRDIARAVHGAVMVEGISAYRAFNIVGPTIPTTREVITYLHDRHGYPLPHFSVPFPLAFVFAGLMELLDPLVPWDPLVTRSIVHLLRDTHVTNDEARAVLGYSPEYDWRIAIDNQIEEMKHRQQPPMRMARPVP